ncbi:ABC transporter permease subunit [Georgenia subflava]|uniref:ABC transporter permease subunit n=1 Tax=Georgenia subflava TaxID=1622177 RepID=A0A6N7ELR8_9MICO|nr:ABC transporter permease subunit [Georgenia subflava]MPV37485.1 ABC transporter permease subunit [Georgenia subflava]
MMRLSRVELRRLFSRRLVVLAMIGGLVVSALFLVGVWQSSQPMSAADLERAEAEYERQLADWEENGEEWVAQCLEDEAREAELTGTDVDFGCEQMEPQREWFIWESPPMEDSFPMVLAGQSYLLVALALLVGATFTAAEMSTGSISSWLTFEPRRLRVYASKVLATGLGVVPVAVLAVAILVTGGWVIARSFGLAGSMDGSAWSSLAAMALRILVLVVLAAMVGSALGVLLRHTAAVLGVVVGYVVVVETMFAGALGRFQPWLVARNIEGWVNHGTVYYVPECTTDSSGTMCDYVERSLSFGHSTAYVLISAAVVVVVGALVFRRRDAA